MASHLLYTQALDDRCEKERDTGIAVGQEWLSVVSYVVVYIDLGISEGMKQTIELAAKKGVSIVYRELGVD